MGIKYLNQMLSHENIVVNYPNIKFSQILLRVKTALISCLLSIGSDLEKEQSQERAEERRSQRMTLHKSFTHFLLYIQNLGLAQF